MMAATQTDVCEEQQLEELEVLESIYAADLVVLCACPPRTYRFGQLIGPMCGGAVVVHLPHNYPQRPPVFDLKDLPLLSDAAITHLSAIHTAADGGVCIYESLQWITEHCRHEECGGGAAARNEARPHTSVTSPSVEDQRHSPEDPRTFALTEDQGHAVTISLGSAGFMACGVCEHVHVGAGISIELVTPSTRVGATITVVAEGVDADAIVAFLELEFEVAPDCVEFGPRLVTCVRDMRHMGGESTSKSDHVIVGDSTNRDHTDDDSDIEARCRTKLPTPQELSCAIWPDSARTIASTRVLKIFTWGDALMKKSALKARGSQFDINAKPFNGRGGGVDIKNNNALQDPKIMLNVASSMAEERGRLMLRQTVRKIEEEDLHTISTFCSKGRHRSVSAAVLLKLIYFPNATIEHLTIK